MSIPHDSQRDPMLAALLTELDRIEPRTRAAVAGLPESKFREVPSDGGWSIAQVFEHLCVANAAYLDGALPVALAKARERGPAHKPWKASFVGGWLTRSVAEGANAMPAPAPWRVGPSAREHVVDEFLAGVARLRVLLLEATDADLGVGLASPASGLIRMNLGDALRIMVVHCHRHLAQAERTRRAVGM